MVNRRLLGLVLRVLLVVVGCAAAGTARAQPKPPQRALGFSKLVFRPAGGDQVGLAGEDFRVHILEDLRGRGVNAVGAENLVFGSDRGGQAEMMLGGTVTELQCQPGSDGREFPASVIRSDRRVDIALLRLALPEGMALPCLPSKLDPVSIGADVYAVGSPASRDLSFSLARGIVSGVRLLDGVQYLQTDAAVNRGNSGGPLVTASGEAAAIVGYKLVGASVEGLAFGVPLGPGLNAIGVTLGNAFTSPELASASAVRLAAPRGCFVRRYSA